MCIVLSFVFLSVIRQTFYILLHSNLLIFFFVASEFGILFGKAFPIPDYKEFLL